MENPTLPPLVDMVTFPWQGRVENQALSPPVDMAAFPWQGEGGEPNSSSSSRYSRGRVENSTLPPPIVDMAAILLARRGWIVVQDPCCLF